MTEPANNTETEIGKVPEESSTEKRRETLHSKIRENSWFGKKCLKIFKVFTNTFMMTFLAEWGDRYLVIYHININSVYSCF